MTSRCSTPQPLTAPDDLPRGAAPGADEPPDAALLRRYVRHKSEAAFARLIRRHLGLVYATCRREVGDPELAEDVTQAVFLILANKAPRLHGGDGLAGWLFQTARLAARNAVRQESGRLRREQELVEQETTRRLREGTARTADHGDQDHPWQAVEPLLNEAVARLRPRDREAILLRFFEGRGLAEVGAQLGVSENAARMRVSRALERLHRSLVHHGAVLGGSVALAALLTDKAAQAAPASALAAVLPLAASTGFLPTSLIAAKVSHLTQGVLHAMWMKTVTTFASLFTVAVTLTAVAVAADYHNRLSGMDWTPIATAGRNLSFQHGLDGWGKAAPNSDAPDYTIRVDPRGPALGLPSALLSANTAHPHGYGTLIQGIRADLYRGKRLHFSASLRTEGVAQGAGLWLRLDEQKGVHAWNMGAHPIKGTTGWRRYGYVLDVPADAQGMAFGSDLTGTGKVWLADVRLEAVGKGVPVTPEPGGKPAGDTARVVGLWGLGRAGHYEQEEVAARAILADPQAPPAERCTAREALAFCERRLGRTNDARAALARFGAERVGLPVDPGVVAEARRLDARMALPSPR